VVTLRVSGKHADHVFRDEAGGHRFQRVPPTERAGRVHTSTVTVAVLPEVTEQQVPLPESDLDWQACRGSGAGGQNRNKVNSAVQLWHIPSGTMVRCESERSQHQNRQTAMALMRARLWAVQQEKSAGNRAQERRQQVGSGMRGDKRRTIAFQRGTVEDHTSGRTWRLKDYLRGDWK
jgi:peptide chain release factor 1